MHLHACNSFHAETVQNEFVANVDRPIFAKKNIIFSVSAILVSKTCCSIVIPKTEIYEPTRDFFGGFFQNLIHAEMIFFPSPRP